MVEYIGLEMSYRFRKIKRLGLSSIDKEPKAKKQGACMHKQCEDEKKSTTSSTFFLAHNALLARIRILEKEKELSDSWANHLQNDIDKLNKEILILKKRIQSTPCKKIKLKIKKVINRKKEPYITIGIASYNHSKYLEQCIDSALNQKYKNFNVLIIDDFSSDSGNAKILKKYKKNKRVRIVYRRKNQGISSSLNQQIIMSTGEWVAFLDCDDFLPKNALLEMSKAINRNPQKKLFFSNRVEVDEENKFIRKVDFGNRDSNPDIFNELMKGMASSHLKIIHKEVFREVGLFDSRYDGIQDYDFYLRTAFYLPKVILHVNKNLYFHRIHSSQNTVLEDKKHSKNLLKLKKEALFRKKLYSGKYNEKISFIILSFNRGNQLNNCVNAILKNSQKINFEIIIWDNGSTDKETIRIVKNFSKKGVVRVFFSEKNLGCSGGRSAASKKAKGRFLIFLDNDVEIKERFVEELILRFYELENVAAVSGRLSFPNDELQLNGAKFKIKNGFIEFFLIDNGKSVYDISTMKKRQCGWLPGGVTMIEGSVFAKFDYRKGFINAYEDNDIFMRISKKGYALLNSPLSNAIHYHESFDSDNSIGTNDYKKIRKKYDSYILSWLFFYEKWNLIIRDSFIFEILGIKHLSDDQIQRYVRDNGSDLRRNL